MKLQLHGELHPIHVNLYGGWLGTVYIAVYSVFARRPAAGGASEGPLELGQCCDCFGIVVGEIWAPLVVRLGLTAPGLAVGVELARLPLGEESSRFFCLCEYLLFYTCSARRLPSRRFG